MALILNSYNPPSTQYFVSHLIHYRNGYRVAFWNNPTVHVERFEDKLKVKLYANIFNINNLPYDFFRVSVEIPSQKISNIPLAFIQRKAENIGVEFEHIEGYAIYPKLYVAEFIIDIASDGFFDRNIIEEKIDMKIDITYDRSYINRVSWVKCNHEELKEELESCNPQYVTFSYSNTVIYKEGEVLFPYFSKGKKDKVIETKYYTVNFKKANPIDSNIMKVFDFNVDKDVEVYLRGYKLKYLFINEKRELDLKYQINKRIENEFSIINQLTYNLKQEDFIFTEDKGFFCPWTTAYIISGNIYLKFGNASFNIIFNNNYQVNQIENLKLNIKNEVMENEEKFKQI